MAIADGQSQRGEARMRNESEGRKSISSPHSFLSSPLLGVNEQFVLGSDERFASKDQSKRRVERL